MESGWQEARISSPRQWMFCKSTAWACKAPIDSFTGAKRIYSAFHPVKHILDESLSRHSNNIPFISDMGFFFLFRGLWLNNKVLTVVSVLQPVEWVQAWVWISTLLDYPWLSMFISTCLLFCSKPWPLTSPEVKKKKKKRRGKCISLWGVTEYHVILTLCCSRKASKPSSSSGITPYFSILSASVRHSMKEWTRPSNFSA